MESAQNNPQQVVQTKRPPSRRAPELNPLPKKTSIGDYLQAELSSLLEWIKSDGLLRTDDELAEEMMRELPFRRRGRAIDQAIKTTIARSKNGQVVTINSRQRGMR